MLTPKIT
jgi:hypothetical protein